MADSVTLGGDEAERLAIDACLGAGADAESARALARATIAAHRAGRPEVGFAHLVDYLAAWREGRINRQPQPVLERPFGACLSSNADGGIAQLGFDLAFTGLVETARTQGISLFTQHNSFTSGELGYYVRRLADEGLVALAFTNANAFVAPAPGMPRLYSTNPLAFGFPLDDGGRPVVIDQSSAATAFVNLSAAAREGRLLDEGIAIDAAGAPTRDARAGLLGALLPFGGRKGANIALMVELMAAGLAGGSWSVDMPDFQSGSRTLDVGLTVIAIAAGAAPGETAERAAAFVARLAAAGVHVPGRRHGAATGAIRLHASLCDRVTSLIG